MATKSENFVIGFVIAALTLSTAIGVICNSSDLGIALGIGGIGVSGLGVVLTYAIYRRQRLEAGESEDRTKAHIEAQLRPVLALIANGRDEPESDDGDAFAEEDKVMAQFGQEIGDGLRVLRAAQVPLSIVAELVDFWKSQGKAGQWSVGNLHSALRKAGKGNPSWYLVFEDRDSLRAWKVSRGGRGKAGSTITEL